MPSLQLKQQPWPHRALAAIGAPGVPFGKAEDL
jgi:hypothetical protein